MAKQGEVAYLRMIGEAGIRHAADKPFSDAHCHGYLMQMGAVMALLPPVPARVLDLGCGTGWTSVFLAKHGYQVVGVDISPDMIFHANVNKQRSQVGNLSFRVADYEELDFEHEFDAVVFYDALHHAVDEELALRMAYRALKSGAICITSEPGRGHAHNPHSLKAVQQFNVTEKDMPLGKIIALGRAIGFRQTWRYPHASELGHHFYQRGRDTSLPRMVGSCFRALRGFLHSNGGIAVMMK